MQYGDFAGIYDSLMYDFDYASWAKFIFDKMPNAENIVEIGCGTGNLTVPLSDRYDITAFDISEEMLFIASEKLRKRGVRPKLSVGDVRSFSLHKPLDGAVCACDVINYLLTPEDVSRAFANIAANLKTGAEFIFDISSENKLYNTASRLFSEDADDVTYIWSNSEIDENKIITMDLTFFVFDGNDKYIRFDETHRQRAHSRNEILMWLEKAGFGIKSVTDNYTDKAASEKTQRITFCAEKIR